MAQSIFIFDFGTDEESAQQARHKIDSWKQGFRLGNKMTLKFDREEAQQKEANEESEASAKTAGAKKSKGKKAASSSGNSQNSSRVKLLVRLDFSDHEKLSHQRWLDRIPTEEPFKSAKPEVIRTGDPEFSETSEHFEALD
jgi:hypothetical protein